jgi:succinate dehydrogenase subunit D
MARSNKPMLWLPFAGGGLVAALVTPVLILITGILVPLGILQLHYETIAAFAHHPIGKLILFGVVALPAWHAAHRLRMTAHDLGLGGGIAVKAACYGTTALLILVATGALAVI